MCWLRVLLILALCVSGCAEPPEAPGGIAVIRMRDHGEIRIRLLPELAPKHVTAFRRLAADGFYDGTTFHRVLPGMFIQGGDPLTKDADPGNDGRGGPGYRLPAEFSDRPHRRGTVSMARADDPNSAGSQFFILVADHPDWKELFDGQYTIFGEVISGIEVAEAISRVPRDRARNHRPYADVVMESVRVVPAE